MLQSVNMLLSLVRTLSVLVLPVNVHLLLQKSRNTKCSHFSSGKISTYRRLLVNGDLLHTESHKFCS